MEKDETCYKIDENKPETCPGNCRTHGQDLNKAVEHIPTRAEKRRLKREIIKQLNPPKYGPVVIYTEAFKREKGELKREYMVRTNIQNLEAFEREHEKPRVDQHGRVY